ncbi:hypothetical protein C8Q70DRAFT_919607 [Cubamyces menziesii]|uniref:Yeast cell wall synthesis Kre9/Knh1-like N-terminal domain-containing protein n=1 Tax=Trametes cubensis TaxID=1111947 RepID=A0AAD7TSD5_9APHY|nr:hypothetical protein C8Q70DRAFT_919607 [Cubamyces menziesii]KAJ8481009.1 hypothetical protein ONZ51_g6297 [Trametes cubensis]
MFASKLAAAFAVVAAAVSAVSAAPAVFSDPKTEIVFRPHITSPQAGAIWPAGSTQTITWDTSDIPEDYKNQTGLILLGYIEGQDTNEHLDVAHPLAVNFPISAGSTQVNVPDVEPRHDYVVVLFGDSGNTSPKFTITSSAVSSLPGLPSGLPSFSAFPSGSAPVSTVSIPSASSATQIVSSVSPAVSPAATVAAAASA